jgi:hypothetical protein
VLRGSSETTIQNRFTGERFDPPLRSNSHRWIGLDQRGNVGYLRSMLLFGRNNEQ